MQTECIKHEEIADETGEVSIALLHGLISHIQSPGKKNTPFSNQAPFIDILVFNTYIEPIVLDHSET